MIEVLLEAERSLAVGMLDHAERLYRQAAENDPRNAIAVVGLARIALERGDEEAAVGFGRQALAIDPDNLAARRLVDRLIVVRAHRGIPPETGPAPSAPPTAAVMPGHATSDPEPDATPRQPPAAATRKRGFLRRLLGRS
ncbi:MAG TPA: tetratricopeptide repeat protein [Vitreimonas sp.]|nr:tetratricopeptide repeat protein [Vitreimonas sp.]